MSLLGLKTTLNSFVSNNFKLIKICAPAKFVIPAQIQIRNYAARKGTRARKEKKKVKHVVEKVGFIPHNQRNKEKLMASRPKQKFDDSWKGMPVDNVYVERYYRMIVYPFLEAVKCHRETHHPQIYNKPDEELNVTIELNMEGEKKTRFVNDFTRIVSLPYSFGNREDRSVIAFSKDSDIVQEAMEAGAQVAGGLDIIKKIQTGDLLMDDFEFCIAHPDIIPELVQLRGLMKKKFPSPNNGTLDVNVGEQVRRFVKGLSYTAKKDEYEKDFGSIKTVIGTLNMDANHLESNFSTLIKDVYSMKPRNRTNFISRCLLWSPPSKEQLKVDHNLYIDSDIGKEKASIKPENVGEKVIL